MVFDDGSGKVVKPLRYDWKWNDSDTGGKYDITFWHPVAPAGYTCLGDIAIRNHSWSQPNADIRCVRDDLLIDGQSWWYWSDKGSGGDYDAISYITTAKVDSNIKVALPANTIRLSGGTAHKVFNYDKVNFDNGPQSIIADGNTAQTFSLGDH